MHERYLITGGAGNLACQLTFELARPGHTLTLVDVADAPAAPTAPGCVYLRGDVADTPRTAQLLRDLRPTAVLHFASLLSGSSEQDRALAWRVNVDGAFGLFEAAVESNVPKFFFPSSLATYGGRLPSPLPEDHPQWPQGLYGVTKVACERLGLYYAARHGLDFRCLRLPVVISRHAPPGAASAYASRAFVEAFEGNRFTFKVAPERLTAAVYVRDVLAGIVRLLDAPRERLERRVYNLHGLSISPAAVAAAVAARVPGAQFVFAPDPQVDALIGGWPAVVDDAAARADWGWAPRFDLDRLADDFIHGLSCPQGQGATWPPPPTTAEPRS